tara:strand:- start:1457 stop:2008 length:552 start_codon:yes stop_codon:yes gene_type:complete
MFLDLPDDIIYNIFSYLEINKLYNIELSNTKVIGHVKNYICNKYNYDYNIIKSNYIKFNNDVSKLNQIVTYNKDTLNNIMYYSENLNFQTIIKNTLVLDKLDIFKYKNTIYNIIKIYYKIFNNILININSTYLIFYNINNYKRINNEYYVHINKKYSVINFYKFIIFYYYLRYLNNNILLYII